MSFLTRYWHAVQRQHQETGSNYGDIRIDLNKLCAEKNTPEVNDVQPNVTSMNPQPTTRPIKDGVMPRSEELEHKFDSSRRSARPDQRVQGMAEETKQPIRVSDDERYEDKRRWRESSVHYQATPSSWDDPFAESETLSGLGVERSSGVRLDKVVINGHGFKRSH